jgi:hypothetical protein
MAVGLGASTSLVFMIVLLFCLTDLPTVLASPTGPLLQIYYQATRSMAGVSTYQECTCRTGLTDRSGHGPRHFQPHGHGLCHPGLDDGCESYCSCFRQGPRFRSPVSFVSAWTVIFGLICQSITARVWMFHQTLIDCRSWILCGAQRDPFRVGRIHADQLHCTQ